MAENSIPIEDRIKGVLNDKTEREKDSGFQLLSDFYETKKKEGAVVKQEYKLPPLDTIGRSFYEPPKS